MNTYSPALFEPAGAVDAHETTYNHNNIGKIKDVEVDDTNKGDGKVLVYNQSLNKFIYTSAGTSISLIPVTEYVDDGTTEIIGVNATASSVEVPAYPEDPFLNLFKDIIRGKDGGRSFYIIDDLENYYVGLRHYFGICNKNTWIVKWFPTFVYDWKSVLYKYGDYVYGGSSDVIYKYHLPSQKLYIIFLSPGLTESFDVLSDYLIFNFVDKYIHISNLDNMPFQQVVKCLSYSYDGVTGTTTFVLEEVPQSLDVGDVVMIANDEWVNIEATVVSISGNNVECNTYFNSDSNNIFVVKKVEVMESDFSPYLQTYNPPSKVLEYGHYYTCSQIIRIGQNFYTIFGSYPSIKRSLLIYRVYIQDGQVVFEEKLEANYVDLMGEFNYISFPSTFIPFSENGEYFWIYFPNSNQLIRVCRIPELSIDANYLLYNNNLLYDLYGGDFRLDLSKIFLIVKPK